MYNSITSLSSPPSGSKTKGKEINETKSIVVVVVVKEASRITGFGTIRKGKPSGSVKAMRKCDSEKTLLTVTIHRGCDYHTRKIKRGESI